MRALQLNISFKNELNIKVADTTRQKKRIKSKAFSSYTHAKKK